MDTIPAPAAFRFLSVEILPAACRVKIMEFMSRAGTCVLSENLSLFFLQSQIAESGKSGCLIGFALYDPYSFPVFSLHILKGLVEIHKTPALRQDRKTIFQRILYLAAHIYIFFKFPCVKLRLPAIQKKAVQILWQFLVMYRRQLCQFSSKLTQQF